jgi:hypothetical protein
MELNKLPNRTGGDNLNREQTNNLRKDIIYTEDGARYELQEDTNLSKNAQQDEEPRIPFDTSIGEGSDGSANAFEGAERPEYDYERELSDKDLDDLLGDME